MDVLRKTYETLLDFFELCVVFMIVFGFVIGGGILFFRAIYWMVS